MNFKENAEINFGILIYQNCYFAKASSNIGDYIQSLSAINIYKKFVEDFNSTKYEIKDFLNLVIKNNVPNFNFVFIKRDNMHELDQYKGLHNIITIMNGWWMHPFNKEGDINFEIPENIHPIFASFHIADEKIFSDKYLNQLQQYQPIGCRDLKTTKKLKKRGVDAYFTGCLTTTIDFFKWNRQNDDVLYVDTKGDGIKSSQMNPKWKNIDYENGLLDAINILEKYSKCKQVHTSRLHCYLPCLAIGVPVNFISPEGNPNIKSWGSKDRFDGLRKLRNDPDKFFKVKTKLIDICLSHIHAKWKR